MSSEYHKVGTTLRDTFTYLDKATYAGVTGQVQADFTIDIVKNGVGNQSAAGFTITEVSAATDPGIYAIEVSGATGFCATTGAYTVRITATADPGHVWETTYYITSDGTAAGTIGVGFSATASNGRITDGTSPLAGATVYLRTPAGALYTSALTNASGLWGPVYFDPAQPGVWSAVAQKAGYGTTSFNVTTTSTTAVGPGADVALASVTSGSGLTLAELMTYARTLVHDRVGSKADTQIRTAVNDALGQLARAKAWEWYRRMAALTLRPIYATGTLTLTEGSASVTLADGTFPAWAGPLASLEIGGQFMPVLSRESATEITLASAWSEDSTTSASWVLFQDQYTLPADCLRFGRLYPGEGWVWQGEPRKYIDVQTAKNAALWGQKYPAVWAIQKDRIHLWPYPNQKAYLAFDYYIRPAILTSGSDEADFDPVLLEVLHRAIDYHLSIQFGQTVSGDRRATQAAYEYALATATGTDKQPTNRHNLFTSVQEPGYWQGARLV
jgi:hypothetical protein